MAHRSAAATSNFLLSVLLAFCVLHARSDDDSHTNLRRSALFHPTDDYTVDCVLVLGHLRYEDNDAQVLKSCMSADGTLYELPAGLLEAFQNEPLLQQSGTLLHITGVTTVQSNSTQDANRIVYVGRMAPQVQVFDQAINSRSTAPTSTGTKNVIALRVKSIDSEVTLSADEMSEVLFGTNVSVARQYSHCSNGALNLTAAHGTGIVNGIGELYINEMTKGIPTSNLHGPLREAFALKYGSEDDYDHIVYCLPNATGVANKTWIGYAFSNFGMSFLNNEWCSSLSLIMHEFGHANLGFGHSGEDGEGHYDDRTCIMGASGRRQDGPQKCFNGYRYWTSNWLQDRQVTVDPKTSGTWGGNLCAFVDYNSLNEEDDYAAINVADLYLVYNAQRAYNSEVNEKANQVTITKSGETPGAPSTMLAGLDMNSTTFHYTTVDGDNLVIELCEADSNGVDFFRISIHVSGQTSACTWTDGGSPKAQLNATGWNLRNLYT